MNRGEFDLLLQKVTDRLTEKNGLYAPLYGDGDAAREEARKLAAAALIAVDEYYGYLTKIRYEAGLSDDK